MKLPENFIEKMKQLLGDEFDAYMESFSGQTQSGIRVNTLKITPDEFERISPFPLRPIPWVKNGYYVPAGEQPAKHPYYYAGLYYIQEPSAMIPASLLPVEPGDKVLDLCAAPGGKTTELAARLRGQGVLVANDISSSRSKALLKNMEIFGVRNGIIVNEAPEKLAKRWSGYFDKILIDAPCSGEGMFRKDPSIIRYYEENGVDYYSEIQKNIILSAAQMLKPGGMLLYSTCTFSPEENEGTIQYLLEQYPEFSVAPAEHREGFSYGRPEWVNGDESLSRTIRLWPHKAPGEGHYAALLKKEAGKEPECTMHSFRPAVLSKETEEFLQRLHIPIQEKQLELIQDKLYLLPEEVAGLKGLHILRSGLQLGEIKKMRFEPSQALASALKADEYEDTIHLSCEDPRVIKYLKGETIETGETKKSGWQLVCVDGFVLGWGKASQGSLKNKYFSGWRWM